MTFTGKTSHNEPHDQGELDTASWDECFCHELTADEIASTVRAKRLAREQELNESSRSLNAEGITLPEPIRMLPTLSVKDAIALATKKGLRPKTYEDDDAVHAVMIDKSGCENSDDINYNSAPRSRELSQETHNCFVASIILDEMHASIAVVGSASFKPSMTAKEAEELFKAKMQAVEKPVVREAEIGSREDENGDGELSSVDEENPFKYQANKPLPENAQKLPKMGKKVIRLNSVV